MTNLKDLTEAEVLAVSERLGEPQWLQDRRLEGFKAFSDLDWPTKKVEEWRYTPPERFDLDRPVVSAGGDAPAPQTGVIAALGEQVAGSIRIVDGALVEAWSAHPGLVVSDIATAAREHPETVQHAFGRAVGADAKFDALNLAGFTAGAFVRVQTETTIDDPITVTIQAEADGAHVPRVLLVLEAFSKAKIYVNHVGGGQATVVEVVETVVGDGAQAQLVTLQDWGEGVDHIGSHRGHVQRNAVYRHLETTLGGGTVYLRPDVGLDRPGGHAELFGVYFASGDQHMEHRSIIHHNAPNTSSESVYKGALQGTARATWFGNIRIEPHAKATTSDETNRNLILTDGAHADSIPFLEILCSDVVQCGHHSSVGQVDEAQLFYLVSRGIPRQEAVRMLVFGFFGEVTDRIELPAVTETVLAEIEREIRHGAPVLKDPRRS
ncbi:MAG TPA: Fe-S cluster assembly protein SufD [Egibacteraceae bacterium]|nr:Fe-S cluster assembly protein SufD [Egibacteraceae bacterium]